MSNLESTSGEFACAATPADHIEVIRPREVPLGGPRAMRVERTLPQRERSLIGPWCFIDRYGPRDVVADGGMDVPPHPHTGLQTATWLFSGRVEHRDSGGVRALVRPGELNLMTAGAGICHSEVSIDPREAPVLRGVQLWIALPDTARQTARGLNHFAPEPVSLPGASALVFLGELAGYRSPFRPSARWWAPSSTWIREPSWTWTSTRRSSTAYWPIRAPSHSVIPPCASATSATKAPGTGCCGWAIPGTIPPASCCSAARRSARSWCCGGTSSAAATTRSSSSGGSGTLAIPVSAASRATGAAGALARPADAAGAVAAAAVAGRNLALTPKGHYTKLRIAIQPSARQHGITDTEIRSVVSHYALTVLLAPRRYGSRPVLYIGPAAPNHPWIEVIADLRNPTTADVFHAMMLRRSLVAALDISGLIDPQYGPQRS